MFCQREAQRLQTAAPLVSLDKIVAEVQRRWIALKETIVTADLLCVPHDACRSWFMPEEINAGGWSLVLTDRECCCFKQNNPNARWNPSLDEIDKTSTVQGLRSSKSTDKPNTQRAICDSSAADKTPTKRSMVEDDDAHEEEAEDDKESIRQPCGKLCVLQRSKSSHLIHFVVAIELLSTQSDPVPDLAHVDDAALVNASSQNTHAVRNDRRGRHSASYTIDTRYPRADEHPRPDGCRSGVVEAHMRSDGVPILKASRRDLFEDDVPCMPFHVPDHGRRGVHVDWLHKGCASPSIDHKRPGIHSLILH